MNPISKPNSVGRERLTWDEIRTRYPNQWVVLIEMEWVDEDAGEFRSAVVMDHSTKRGEAFSRTAPRLLESIVCAHLYTGEVRGSLPETLAHR